jgi:hypothetical protein
MASAAALGSTDPIKVASCNPSLALTLSQTMLSRSLTSAVIIQDLLIKAYLPAATVTKTITLYH